MQDSRKIATPSGTESWGHIMYGQPRVHHNGRAAESENRFINQRHLWPKLCQQQLFHCALEHWWFWDVTRIKDFICLVYSTIQATTSLWWCTLACKGPSTNNRILTCIIHPSLICSGSNTCGNSTFINWTSTKKAFQHNCPLHPSISVLLRVALELVQ